MRIIDADALILSLAHEDTDVCADYGVLGGCEWGFSNEKLDHLIANAPTVDAVEVVRCKDCRHQTEKGWCCFHSSCVKRCDFCSYGERRDE